MGIAPARWGKEFLVNTTTLLNQHDPAITALANGRFVVAWADPSQSGGDTSSSAVRAQVFNADGGKSGVEFLVNTTTAWDQRAPSIVALAEDRFVVAWEDWSESGGDTSGRAVRAQVFKADGTKLGVEFLVNTTTSSNQYEPTITTLTNGRFVVAWTDSSYGGGDTSPWSVRAQVFHVDGARVGPELLVNTTTSYGQHLPTIASLSDSRFVVVWMDHSASGGDVAHGAVRAQIFNSGGAKIGPEILINATAPTDWQSSPTITPLAGDRFVVSWTDKTDSDAMTGYEVRAQIVNADGTLAGTKFVVNTNTDADQCKQTITALTDGRFVVAWEDYGNGLTNLTDIRAQVFNDDGTKSGAEFLVNSSRIGYQTHPTITALADGRFVVAWTDEYTHGADTSGDAVRAQIFDPRATAVFLAGSPGADDYVGTNWNDTLYGGDGNDRLNGANGADSLQGEAGNDSLLGGDGNDRLQGGTGNDLLNGQAGNDKLFGQGGNDRLLGGLGNDTLTGGAGRDAFRFDTTLDATANKDTITDFNPTDDTLQLENAIFTRLSATGALNTANFRASATSKAVDANDYILYNTTSGALYYDADGSGIGVAIQFASLPNLPNLTAADFLVI
jgi:Ca2+-binding RTX toxin-like protein